MFLHFQVGLTSLDNRCVICDFTITIFKLANTIANKISDMLANIQAYLLARKKAEYSPLTLQPLAAGQTQFTPIQLCHRIQGAKADLASQAACGCTAQAAKETG